MATPNIVIQVNIPQDAPIIYVIFSAEIVPTTTEGLLHVMAQCANKQVQHVYLLLTGPGGSVESGMQLYSTLRAMPFEFTTHNVGSVNSVSNVVFLAGSQRFAVSEATFMFHGVGLDIQRGERLEEARLREGLDTVLNDQKRIGTIVARHTNLNSRQVANLFRRAQTKDASYALSSGIISQIKDVQIPAGSPVVTLVFQR